MTKSPTLPIPLPTATNPQDRQWQAAVTEMLNLRSNHRPNSAEHAWVTRGEMAQALGAVPGSSRQVSYETIMSAVKTVDGEIQKNITAIRENAKSIEAISQKNFVAAYGVASHGVETLIDGVFLKDPPRVFVFPKALPTYDPNQNDKRQIQRLDAGDVVGKGDGKYAFTPQAELVAESAVPAEEGGEPDITTTQIATGSVFYIAINQEEK